VLDEHLLLECGRTLANPTLHYAVYGRLNAARDNAVLVCHALTGSALVGSWWPEIFAPGAVLSLEHDFVICINMLGSCYGSTGPGLGGSRRPARSLRARLSAGFDPRQRAGAGALLDSLGIRGCGWFWAAPSGACRPWIGPSSIPERVERALIIGVAPLSAMGLALNHLQRQAILHDPDWAGGRYLPQRPPRRGLALARQIGMISYKSAPLFEERFGRNPNRNGEDPWALDDQGGGLIGGRFDIAGYLDHQGERFIDRFDANAYLAILRTMDTWDPLRGYSSAEEAFGRIRARLSFVGISSDWLFPAETVRDFAEAFAPPASRPTTGR
jgi:homoserine O-acetyltransferase